MRGGTEVLQHSLGTSGDATETIRHRQFAAVILMTF